MHPGATYIAEVHRVSGAGLPVLLKFGEALKCIVLTSFAFLDSWFNENLDHQSAIRLPSVARSMYLTQPPFTACKLRIYLHSGGYLWEILYDKSGMRLGHIADAVAQLLHQCDQFGQKIEEGRCERPEKINRIMVSFRAEVEGEEQNGD